MNQNSKDLAPPPYEEVVGTSSQNSIPSYPTNSAERTVANDTVLRPGDVQFTKWVNENVPEPNPMQDTNHQPQAYSQQISIESDNTQSTSPQHALPTMTTTTTVYVNSNTLGPIPAHIKCPHCFQEVNTTVKYVTGLLTWLICGGSLLFG
uniref:LITAF domain-containing protein n=1 Tax=Acrobeloides nanus TaxID=290746 RepID=A0A914DPW7_9BILA